MITGAVLIILGIIIGYSIPFWKNPHSIKETRISKTLKKIFSGQATVIDMTPLDLGNEKEN